jgi:hypothetical protein
VGASALLIRVPVVVQVSLRADLRLREGLVVVAMPRLGGLRKSESQLEQLQVVLSVNLNALLLAMAPSLCYLQAGPPWLVSRRPR